MGHGPGKNQIHFGADPDEILHYQTKARGGPARHVNSGRAQAIVFMNTSGSGRAQPH